MPNELRSIRTYFYTFNMLHDQFGSFTGAFGIVEHMLTSEIIDTDVRSLDYDATTPLFWAIKENQCDMVEMLLDFGASETWLNIYGDSAVFVAVYYSQVSVLKILVDHGCRCDYQSKTLVLLQQLCSKWWSQCDSIKLKYSYRNYFVLFQGMKEKYVHFIRLGLIGRPDKW